MLFQVYWVGPLLGALVAGLLYDLVFAANASCPRFKAWLADPNYDSNGPKSSYLSVGSEGNAINSDLTLSTTDSKM